MLRGNSSRLYCFLAALRLWRSRVRGGLRTALFDAYAAESLQEKEKSWPLSQKIPPNPEAHAVQSRSFFWHARRDSNPQPSVP